MTNQILNSSFTTDCEDILRQLREAIEASHLPENSWAAIHSCDVERNIEALLSPLAELTNELKKIEREAA